VINQIYFGQSFIAKYSISTNNEIYNELGLVVMDWGVGGLVAYLMFWRPHGVNAGVFVALVGCCWDCDYNLVHLSAHSPVGHPGIHRGDHFEAPLDIRMWDVNLYSV
jgi:hypothetical protein